MDIAARRWFDSHTFDAAQFDSADLLRAKRQSGQRVSVVIPARNEAATVAAVVGQIRQALMGAGLVDELVVLDSDSTDDTAAVARAAGAAVFAARDIDTGTPVSPGKGEALWKSLFVTSGDLLVFIDADLTEWGPHFVTGLLGPLLTDPDTLLSKGFYDRLADDLPGEPAVPTPDAAPQGGRVTELVARPLLNLYWPELAAVVQPLAGEWAIRRSLIESLPIPVGYGVEFASLTDTWRRHGLAAIAQVDLGRRGHRHQNVHDLGVMAAEILATAMRRLPLDRAGVPEEAGPPVTGPPAAAEPSLQQFDRAIPGWRSRPVPVLERPAARANERYRAAEQRRTAARCSS
ncbi:MAG TPA: glucosyl-3-phosphoglycerate synthase [Jatrophihabitans sp.]|jgi:glucosyl-3-phosphoglycerate synthase|uniref:glucosyl-3-phosphoglycerate synthase n=1 Tax=Jatrophihabitans sp. TaxID=1932789 RepID=UPI002F00BE68